MGDQSQRSNFKKNGLTQSRKNRFEKRLISCMCVCNNFLGGSVLCYKSHRNTADDTLVTQNSRLFYNITS